MKSKKNALVVGATGLVGKELMYGLLENEDYALVHVWVRQEMIIKHEKLRQHIVDFGQIEQLPLPDGGIDEAYCALGTTIAKAKSKDNFRRVDHDYVLSFGKWCKTHQVSRVGVVSAVDASVDSAIYYAQVKGAAEKGLAELGLARLHIFRPSLLLGKRQEWRLGEKIAIMLAPLLSPLMIGSWEKYKPIHAAVLARSMREKVSGASDAAVSIWEGKELFVS